MFFAFITLNGDSKCRRGIKIMRLSANIAVTRERCKVVHNIIFVRRH